MGCIGNSATDLRSAGFCDGYVMRERFTCLKCEKSEASTLKLMPCLHLYCFECLEELVDSNSIAMPKKDENIKCSIFPCSVCGYVVRVVNNDTTFLKNVQFHGISVENLGKRYDIMTFNSANETNAMCKCCENATLDDFQLYCATCDIFICANCLTESKHDLHDFGSDDAVVGNKRLNLFKLCSKMNKQKVVLYDQLQMIENIFSSLQSNKEEVKCTILNKYDKIIEKINTHKTNLLSELESTYSSCCVEQTTFKNDIVKDIGNLEECLRFCSRMLEDRQKKNLVNIYSEMSTHVSRILSQKTPTLDIIQHTKLEETDVPKEDLLIEKLFGSLIIGSIVRNSPHLANVYHTNLSWPCGLATNTKDFMLSGKLETFGGMGKLFFSDKDMKIVKYIDLPETCLPVDLLHLPDDTLLLSTNDGNISKYSFQGALLDKWEKCFEGMTGRLAQLDQECFIVTTINNFLICSNEDGKILERVSLDINSPVRCMTVRNKQIYCILEDNTLKIFDLFGSPAKLNFDFQLFDSKMKCPSSLICDPFGNLLVSDFTNDSIYIFDQKGHCLGKILSRENDSIACPNKIILDSCGSLYVSQYGGDVLVFDYLSCAKKI